MTRAVDEVAFCRDAGYRKPDPRAFELILGRLGVTPGEGLFVGDDPGWDLAGPAGVGMDAVLIDRSGMGGGEAIRSLREVAERL